MKYYFLFNFLVLFIFIGCSKDEKDDSNINPLQESKIVEELLRSNNSNFVQLAFRSQLNEKERFTYVYNRIKYTADFLNLNEDQLELIHQALNILSPEVYVKNSLKHRDILNNFIPEWIEKVKDNFTREEIIFLFASYIAPTESAKILVNTAENLRNPVLFSETPCPNGYERKEDGHCYPTGEGIDCGCKSKNSVFTLCGTGTSTIDEICHVNRCTLRTFCGILFLEDCDGMCIFQPH